MFKKNKGDYPPEWESGEIQARIKAAANHRCEQCGIPFRHDSNKAIAAINAKGKPIIGTCHHIDWDRQNSDPSNLVFLCQTCHTAVHGYGWKPGDMIPLAWKHNVPAWVDRRGLPRLSHPQLDLPLFFDDTFELGERVTDTATAEAD